MRRLSMLLLLLVVVFGLSGCAAEEKAEGKTGGGTKTQAGQGQTQAGEEDLFKQWGPDQVPDRYAEPLQFAYWRVDELFRSLDKDQNGKIEQSEFMTVSRNKLENFKRMDANGDGFLTKKEVAEDVASRLVPQELPPQSSTD